MTSDSDLTITTTIQPPSLLCITCSKTIKNEKELTQSIIHSCCQKPVCKECLQNRPRLATFCVLCEGAQHALRKKGPREDVIRAGQTFFDFDKLVDDEDYNGDEEEIRNSSSNKLLPPPPAFSQSTQDQAFVLGEDDTLEEDASRIQEQQQMPSLLDERSSIVYGEIDTTKSANGVSSTATSSSNSHLKDTLQSALDGRISSSQSTIRNSQDRSEIKFQSKDADSSGLTRQYWLRPNDTLMSISLRFRISTSTLCKLNGLPISTATSTPHLIHTRSFLLIPEDSIKRVLENSPEDLQLNQALNGPAPMNRKQKIKRARKEAQSKFRSKVLQNESITNLKKDPSSSSIKTTVCDDRAAKAYIALMESELQFIDFGDGVGVEEEEEEEVKKVEKIKPTEAAEDEALIDSARQRRFDEIVKQALCRWEMDSDWERQQRSMGFDPHSSICGEPSSSSKATTTKKKSSTPSWLGWLNGGDENSQQSQEKSNHSKLRKCHPSTSEKFH